MLEVRGVPVAEGEIEGEVFGAGRVAFAGKKIEAGESLPPETPCFEAGVALVGIEANAAPDASAEPEIGEKRSTIRMADVAESRHAEIEAARVE